MITQSNKIIIGFLIAISLSAISGISFALIKASLSNNLTQSSSENEANQNKDYQESKNIENNLSVIPPPRQKQTILTTQLLQQEEKKFKQGSEYFNEADRLLAEARDKNDSQSAIFLLNEAQKKLEQADKIMQEFEPNSPYYQSAQNYINYIPFYADSINQWKNYFTQLDTYQAKTHPWETTINNNNFIDLTYHNKQYVMAKAKKQSVVLTFDDGPSPQYTEAILDILRKYNVKATFFVVGSQVSQYCPILRRIYQEGHEIGNHSYNHPWMGRISSEEQQQEIFQTQSIIENCIGSKPRWFRSPYASQNESTLKIAHQAGLNTALWTIDTEDWRKTSTTNSIIEKALNYRSNNIILMHDGVEPNPNFKHPSASSSRSNTVQSLDIIIQRFQDKGFQFVTISEAFSSY
ncbi:polysaccharide deacetylase family protein [Crocosphaera chwakensis]|uniref:Chitooligosaccharide deacetylase n=1 Tax=Crocosphaera chwakensis CCY0110 TaxID=391612 RepID=A3IMM8_9CHRO|nr:polysaccharide deacetylase family protein [Crocosphaera chwakensis]EAZ92131.1 chitooligosaccharide deacetylase [Crocosphaera chwakensis CCY0110]